MEEDLVSSAVVVTSPIGKYPFLAKLPLHREKQILCFGPQASFARARAVAQLFPDVSKLCPQGPLGVMLRV